MRFKREPGSLGSGLGELKAGTFAANARFRAQRRRSPWNLVLIPLGLGSVIAVNYLLFRVVWEVHTLFYPSHHLHDFWQRGITLGSFVPSFLMVFAPTPGSIGAGLMLGNLLAWTIPGARRTFNAEASGFPGTDFRSAMRGLWQWVCVTLPAGMVIALGSAYFLKSLK
jgi:hypothetical protein